jgi:hypothetical protein
MQYARVSQPTLTRHRLLNDWVVNGSGKITMKISQRCHIVISHVLNCAVMLRTAQQKYKKRKKQHFMLGLFPKRNAIICR